MNFLLQSALEIIPFLLMPRRHLHSLQSPREIMQIVHGCSRDESGEKQIKRLRKRQCHTIDRRRTHDNCQNVNVTRVAPRRPDPRLDLTRFGSSLDSATIRKNLTRVRLKRDVTERQSLEETSGLPLVGAAISASRESLESRDSRD